MASSALPERPGFESQDKFAPPTFTAHSQAPPSANVMSLSITPATTAATALEPAQFKQEQGTLYPRPGVPQQTFTLLSTESTLPVKDLSVGMERSVSAAERWEIALERAVKGIVTIKFAVTRTFERTGAESYSATGFVVDRTRGIILSNGHVVNPGPTTSTALFNKYEEIPIEPLYADPVHDFGFFKFDPNKVKFSEIEEIELYPQGAKVGLDIRVCGNDAGEQRSILAGTLARLDRASPFDSDFNTFYYQAALGASTGSSGSPMLDPCGRAVAMCAGGSTISASTFYLPLDRVLRALKLIREGKPVSRGTLQTTFVHISYDSLRKLGLPEEIETISRHRHPEGTGLLGVAGVVPEGPGYVAGLQTGDILLSCFHPAFGQLYVDNFYPFWEVIDEIVGDIIQLVIFRGAEYKTIEATVQDLHSLIPNAFFEVGQAIVHPLSYQVARLNNLPCKGLIVAYGGMFDWLNNLTPFLITELEGMPVVSLNDFIEVVRSIPDRKKIKYKYRTFGAWQENIALADMDHHFYGMSLFTRHGAVWERQSIMPNPSGVSEKEKGTFEIGTNLSWSEHLMKALVKVRCRLPYPVKVCTVVTCH